MRDSDLRDFDMNSELYRFYVEDVIYCKKDNTALVTVVIRLDFPSGPCVCNVMQVCFTLSCAGKENERSFKDCICCTDEINCWTDRYKYIGSSGFIEVVRQQINGELQFIPVKYLSPVEFYNRVQCCEQRSVDHWILEADNTRQPRTDERQWRKHARIQA